MKKLLLVLAFFGLFLANAPKAEAKGVIVYSNGETLKKTHDLPAEAEIDGQHVNLGVHYESFEIFWLPLWNYGDYKWALINDAEDTWYELSAEEVQEISESFELDLPAEPTLPLMTQIGLKPIAVLFVLYLIYSIFSPNKEEDEEESAAEPEGEEPTA